MLLEHVRIFTRRRRATAVGAAAALVGVMIVAPAHAAAEVCLYEVSNANEYLAALECASESETATTITLTDDITFPAEAYGSYSGIHDLTIDGDGHVVTHDSDDGSFNSAIFLDAYGPEPDGPDQPHITVRDITVQQFATDIPLMAVSNLSSLTLINAHFLDNESHGDSLMYLGAVARPSSRTPQSQRTRLGPAPCYSTPLLPPTCVTRHSRTTQ